MRAVHWAALAVVLAGTALVLHSMGRPWWCQAGDLVPWSVEIHSRHNSQHLVDAYSLTHALHGLLFYWGLWLVLGRVAGATARAAIALGIETTWEIVENTDFIIERYRAATISLDYYGDSVINSVADIGCFVGGYAAEEEPEPPVEEEPVHRVRDAVRVDQVLRVVPALHLE